jgi:hypothetical protein
LKIHEYHVTKATNVVISRFTQWLWGKTNRIESIQNETYDNLACPSGITRTLPGALPAFSLDDASQSNLPTPTLCLLTAPQD